MCHLPVKIEHIFLFLILLLFLFHLSNLHKVIIGLVFIMLLLEREKIIDMLRWLMTFLKMSEDRYSFSLHRELEFSSRISTFNVKITAFNLVQWGSKLLTVWIFVYDAVLCWLLFHNFEVIQHWQLLIWSFFFFTLFVLSTWKRRDRTYVY